MMLSESAAKDDKAIIEKDLHFSEEPYVIVDGDYLLWLPRYSTQDAARAAAVRKIKKNGQPVVVAKININYMPNHGFEIEEILNG